MKAMPTIPNPTTTTFFLPSSDCGICGACLSKSCALIGSLLACMPGDESAHDMIVLHNNLWREVTTLLLPEGFQGIDDIHGSFKDWVARYMKERPD